ncbi:proteoglycan 4-like [Pyrus ussuriensis x Pyrus communis]|uniref:Proteoglycan 4-like n=1 Tax=Pyrus ussuriensis x Pyrus communis TaxID=2448454 RepID=A0A5N5IC64_9ROSA|nr:proteoglycan 4-like [Pyrus ussuriensis x Pyrus communis]
MDGRRVGVEDLAADLDGVEDLEGTVDLVAGVVDLFAGSVDRVVGIVDLGAEFMDLFNGKVNDGSEIGHEPELRRRRHLRCKSLEQRRVEVEVGVGWVIGWEGG